MDGTQTAQLVKALDDRRWQDRITTRELCRRLGITTQTWYCMVRGDLVAGPKVELAVLRRYPDIAERIVGAQGVA